MMAKRFWPIWHHWLDPSSSFGVLGCLPCPVKAFFLPRNIKSDKLFPMWLVLLEFSPFNNHFVLCTYFMVCLLIRNWNSHQELNFTYGGFLRSLHINELKSKWSPHKIRNWILDFGGIQFLGERWYFNFWRINSLGIHLFYPLYPHTIFKISNMSSTLTQQ